MSAIFCCSSISPYRPGLLDHEAKFTAFMCWASLHKSSLAVDDESASTVNSAASAHSPRYRHSVPKPQFKLDRPDPWHGMDRVKTDLYDPNQLHIQP